MSPQLQHVSEEALSAFLDGELAPGELRSTEAHLEECAACRRALESLRRTASLLAGLERLASPEELADEVSERVRRRAPDGLRRSWAHTPRLPRPRPFLWSMAASVLLLVTLVFTAVRLGMVLPSGMPAGPAPPEGAQRNEEPPWEKAEAGEQFRPVPKKQTQPDMRAPAASPMPGLEEARERQERDEVELSRRDRSVGEVDRPGAAEGLSSPPRREAQETGGVPAEEKAGAARGEAEAGQTLSVRYEGSGGTVLGTLQISLPSAPLAAAHPGIRIHCEPDGRRGYGSRANPVREPQIPAGYLWPEPLATEYASGAVSGEPARLPRVAFRMKGSLDVHADGTASTDGMPPWVQAGMVMLRFRPGMCGNGQPATTRLPFEAEWVPAKP